jgi:transcriptional repressor NrdR
MKCPYCGSEDLRTLETRDSQNNAVRRRKQCANCERRFTTYEYIEKFELMVRKKDGRAERFDLDKIVRGLQKACEKRPVSLEQIRDLAEQVRQDLMTQGKEEVTSHEIGDLVIKHLKRLDRVAYVRFASVYRRFEEPEDFQTVLREVRK